MTMSSHQGGRRRRRSRRIRLSRVVAVAAAVSSWLLLGLLLVHGDDQHHDNDADASTEQAAWSRRFSDFATAHTEQLQPGLRRQLLHYSLFYHLHNHMDKNSNSNNHTAAYLQDQQVDLVEQVFAAYTNSARHRSHSKKPDRSQSLHAALPPFPESLRQDALHRLRHMFTHAYDNYMVHAYPAPELKPLSCTPGHFKLVELQALTLIDSLDMLVIMRNYTEFARAAERLRQLQTSSSSGIFGVDQNVSVFETNIRVVGGLVSAHQLAQAYLGNRVPYDAVFAADQQVLWGHHHDSQQQHQQYNQDNGYNEDHGYPLSPFICSSSTTFLVVNKDAPTTCQSSLSTANGPTKKLGVNTTDDAAAADTCSARYWHYDGFLLNMAVDIANRLLPAFDTKTGIPYGTVNLLFGVPQGETTVASLAGGGTLTLEMELLSRLSGDYRFGKAAKLASRALFMRHSPQLQLFGKHIDIESGQWTETLSGVGSNSDSFYEYLAKHYMLFPKDDDFWTMLQSAYSGIYNNSRSGEWYPDVDMNVGVRSHARQVLESLMAFYPGLQVLLGEVTPAARTLNSMFIVREILGFLPERFHFGMWKPDVGRGAAKHPLRPELLESCYFMHRATKDITPPLRRMGGTTSLDGEYSGWQWAAEFALSKLERMTRVDCGYASVHSISPETTGKLTAPFDKDYLYDEMPSFYLSETIKYLYLTFDDDNILHTDDDRDWVFTTEAHPIHSVPKPELSKTMPNYMDQQVESLKQLLKNRLSKRSRKNAAGNYYGDFWSEETTMQAYRKELMLVETDVEIHRSRIKNASDYFFDKRQIIASFVPTSDLDAQEIFLPRDDNVAHLAMKNLGIGPGYLLRKACPNIYSSDLLWMNALNGGAMDYAETYVTVGSDNISEHPNSFIALGAAEALGILGSGQMFAEKYGVSLQSCPIAAKHVDDAKPNDDDKKEESATLADQTSPASKLVRVASSLGEFEVETYPGGEGFYIQHVESGQTLVATFLFDKSDAGKDLVMVSSAIRDKSDDNDDEQNDKASRWRRMKSKLQSLAKHAGEHDHATDNFIHARQDLGSMTDREVIVSDFHGNSFYCEVEVVEKILAPDGDDDHHHTEEEVLARYPCAPALFGPTSFAELINSDGICIEKMAYAPMEDDEVGCLRADSTSSDDRSDFVPINARELCDPNAPTETCATLKSIRIVRRGGCSFYSKAVNQRLRWDADGMIVVNDYDSDLFVMSYSTDGEIVLSSEEIPCSVLLSGRDGEDLLTKLDVDKEEEDSHIVVRISVSPQAESPSAGGDDLYFPLVQTQPGLVQIYANGGWGVQAQRTMFGGGSTIKDWNLQLVGHRLSKAASHVDEASGEADSDAAIKSDA